MTIFDSNKARSLRYYNLQGMQHRHDKTLSKTYPFRAQSKSLDNINSRKQY